MNSPSDQQKQTLDYFKRSADEWQRKAAGQIGGLVNVISQRNASVLTVAARTSGVGRFLDIGCGTGELVLAMAAKGVDAVGIDFADEMIAACQTKKRQLGAEKAEFIRQSIFDYSQPGAPFDVISGIGLIEYISPDELDLLLDKCARMLRPGGKLVLGSRNRLFNAYSLSDFTALELKLGTIEALLREALAIASAPTAASALEAAMATAANYPSAAAHPLTGIKVDTRHQYTPGELARKAAAKHFRAKALFPIHYHSLPVPAISQLRDIHIQIADLVGAVAPEDHRLAPIASSFVVELERA